MATLTVEQSFIRDVFSEIDAEIENIKFVVTQGVLPQQDYAYNVGYLNALKDARGTMSETLKAYFPTT